MLHIAIKMLIGDKVKYIGILLGIAFTSFLVTFALAFFAGFMTRGFALISENSADVWVMDKAVSSVEQTINMPDYAISRIRNILGVKSASPLRLGNADVIFPNGRVQSFQVIGVDDITLLGIPKIKGGLPSTVLRVPDTVIISSGGTTGKLQTPIYKADQWTYGEEHLKAPSRSLNLGDTLLINDIRIKVAGVAQSIPRFPPRPLIYTTFSHANNILLHERKKITFVLVQADSNISASKLALRIEKKTGFRARSSHDFKSDTLLWLLINSEDVGDMTTMLYLAIIVGLGVTGVMLYMFTYENLRQYAILKAMGAKEKLLISMVFTQVSLCAFVGTGIGLGACGIIGNIINFISGYPFRMMWFSPILTLFVVLIISFISGFLSIKPIIKLNPADVFSAR